MSVSHTRFSFNIHIKTTSKKHCTFTSCISNVFIINVSIIYVHDKLEKKNHDLPCD